jgi:hypothetical protein
MPLMLMQRLKSLIPDNEIRDIIARMALIIDYLQESDIEQLVRKCNDGFRLQLPNKLPR